RSSDLPSRHSGKIADMNRDRTFQFDVVPYLFFNIHFHRRRLLPYLSGHQVVRECRSLLDPDTPVTQRPRLQSEQTWSVGVVDEHRIGIVENKLENAQ